MAKKKDYTEVEQELYELIYEYAVNNSMIISSIEAVSRGVVKDLKDRAKIVQFLFIIVKTKVEYNIGNNPQPTIKTKIQ